MPSELPARVAVLDVDGTLLPGSLGLRMLHEIARRHADRADAAQTVLDLYSEYIQDKIGYDDMASAAIQLYCRTLSGLTESAVHDIALHVWAEQRDQVFAFVRPLVSLLTRHAIEPVIVSSSPEPVVKCLAASLRILRYRGSRFSLTAGQYDGDRYDSPYFEGKQRSVIALYPGRHVDWPKSVAVGNSLGDRTVLSAAGHAFVFEPDRQFRVEVADRHWRVVHRENILRSISERLGPAPGG